MFEMKKRRALYVYMRGLKQVNQLKKFGDIAYISNKMHYVALYVNEEEADDLLIKLKKYRFVKTVKASARPDIDPDLGDQHDDVFFEEYDQEQANQAASAEATTDHQVDEDK
ncbi:YlbG family protein [Fructobacillus sp. M158]|uniref:YlbG family protein n=1 Tax=Fructobacillus parabroussonetiae TaxID=2713174 RepID=UPI00200AA84C|nr:YlbG family protein [Fructobacillus parabroussonetiae]MCK8616807.1 YlbG family protein [Fructobacillus parabroussonetiae]